nr:MAG TPA: hypothetical protein [Caudoviricetes sp.]
MKFEFFCTEKTGIKNGVVFCIFLSGSLGGYFRSQKN